MWRQSEENDMSNLLAKLPDAIHKPVNLGGYHDDLAGLIVWVRTNLTGEKRQERRDATGDFRQVMLDLRKVDEAIVKATTDEGELNPDLETQKAAILARLKALEDRSYDWWAGVLCDDDDGKPGAPWTADEVRAVAHSFEEKGYLDLWRWLVREALENISGEVRQAKKV
jgi:hypothetical protein